MFAITQMALPADKALMDTLVLLQRRLRSRSSSTPHRICLSDPW